MPYELGTASGYTDLLERLKDFISDPARIIGDHPNMDELVAIDDGVGTGEPSNAWTIDLWDDNRVGGVGECVLYAHGPGSAGADEIYVFADTYSSVGDDYYNWRLAGMTGYAAGVDITLQPGATQSALPRMLLWNQPIKYWFVANGRRFIVVAKVSSVYEACYLGYALPYGLPTQFPYPLVVGGAACPDLPASSNPTQHRYSSTDHSHRGFASPYCNSSVGICTQIPEYASEYSSLKVLTGAGWVNTRSRDGSTYYYTNVTWPYGASYSQSYQPYPFTSLLKANIDGSYPVFPIVAMLGNPTKHIVGELQGCFAVPGHGGIAAEDTFTIDGKTYIAFPIAPNADRGDWWALKKE